MRTLLLAVLLFTSYACYAQSDYLVVRLNSGVIDTIKVSDISSIKFESLTTVDEKVSIYSDSKNFPNPFTESTTIEFELAKSGNVDLFIYDNFGKVIRKLICGDYPAGKVTVGWDTKDEKGDAVPSGVYFYEIRSLNTLLFKQIIKVK